MKILVAEDEPISLKMLGRALEKLGHEVIPVENGQKAWEIFQSEEIHFIISDWEMPLMDGVTLCRKLRGASTGWYCYFILVTVNKEISHLKQAFEAGVDDFIAKPFNVEELEVRIKTGERIINLEKEHTTLNEAVIKSRNQLKAVFDSLTPEFIILDRGFAAVVVNKPFISNYDLEFNEVIGTSVFEMDNDLFGDESRKAIESVFKSGEPNFFYSQSRSRKERPWLRTSIVCRSVMNRGRLFRWLLQF